MSDEIVNQEAEARLLAARNHNRKNELTEARLAYQEAAELFAGQDDVRGQCRAWLGLAKVYGKQQEYSSSWRAFEQAADFAALAEWPDKEIEGRYNQGLTLQQLGLKSALPDQLLQAIAAFEKAVPVARRSQDRASLGVLLVSLGFACAWVKQDDKAIRYFAEAAPFALDNVDFDTAFSVLSSLGVLLSNQGRGVEAIPHFERALELSKTAEGDIVAVADTYANLGIAYEKAGRLEDAIEATDTWREILQVSGDVKLATANAMLKRLQAKVNLEGRG